MSWICFVKKENSSKAEDILRKDFDLAAKQSITVRDANAIGIKENGSFFLIDGSEQGIARCKELIKDFVENMDEKKLEEAEKKIREEQEKALSGFGGIFG